MNDPRETTEDDEWLDELLAELERRLEEEEPEEPYAGLVEALVTKYSCSPEQALAWVAESNETLGEQTKRKRQDDEELLALLDGPFKVLRDDTFSDPDRVLVWDKAAVPVVQALTFEEAMARYQCGGAGSQWSPEDVDKIKVEKRLCLGLTLDSYAAQEAGVTSGELECASPCLFVSGNPLDAHRWVTVKSLLNPAGMGK
jgi:hypothetical protein